MALRLHQAHHPAVLLLSVALAAALAGCGNDDPAPPEPDPAEAPKAEALEPVLGDGDAVVVIGDSLATVSPPTYADLLAAAARRVGAEEVTTSNLAEPGTTTEDWLPGTPLFEERLRPALADADVVLMTAGGNDLQEALGGGNTIGAVGALESAGAAYDTVDRSGRHLRRTFKAIRGENPDARVVYVGYPDYSSSDAFRLALGTTGTLALGAGLSALRGAAEDAGPDALVDMTTATSDYKRGVDVLLAELEYLSPAGHEFYAEEIASALAEPPSG